jgi:tetratricopeptide (TPR) repeat protein
VFGLSAIARPTVLPFAAVLLIYLYWQDRSKTARAWKAPAMLLAGLVVAIAPIAVRNYVESGEFVLIGAYGGINLYIGNNLQSDGVSATVPGAGLDWWHQGLMDDTRRMANEGAGRELTAAEQSTYWRNRALQEMSENPGFFVKHVGRKLLLFLGGYELANNFDIRYLSRQIPILNVLILRQPVYWPWGIILPLGLAGMVFHRRWTHEQRLPILFLISYLPTMLLFFVTGRYRLPLIPFLAMFAAVVLVGFFTWTRARGFMRLTSAAVVLLLMLAVARLDPLDYASGSAAQGHQMMAALYEGKGDPVEAERYYNLALRADPTLPHAHNDLGLLLLGRGQVDSAIFHLERAVAYRPDEWLIQYNLGLAYLTNQELDRAIDQYRAVLAMAPEMADAANDLALIWLRKGYPDSALVYYRRLQEAYPGHFIYVFSAGLCHHALDHRDSALTYYRRTLDLEPGYPKTYFNLGMFWIEEGAADSARYYLREMIDRQSGLPDLEDRARRLLDSLSGPNDES